MSKKALLVALASMSTICVLIIWMLIRHNAVTRVQIDPDMQNATHEVSIDYPEGSRGAYADVKVISSGGDEYVYRIFNQRAGYNSYSDYLSAHGCSTCALTSILRNVEGLEDLTPDKCVDIQREVAGEETFNENFSRAPRKQMPITQYGAKRVFEKYGIEYRLPSADPQKREAEITEWLKNGYPVYFTIGNGKDGHLSSVTHTILLIGIDDEGFVIIGDSVLKSAVHWGSQGLVKTGKLTVSDMLSFIKNDGEWAVCRDDTDDSHFFYKDSSDRGYLLVRLDRKKGEDIKLATTAKAD